MPRMLLFFMAVSLPLLSSCQAPEPRRDTTTTASGQHLPEPGPGLCQHGSWHFANRSGVQSTPLRERVAPYGFMALEETNGDPAPNRETLLSPFLLDVEPIIHLQAEQIGLTREAAGLLVSAWAGNTKLAEQRIEARQTSCSDGKLTVRMPGDWRYGFGSPGHASFTLVMSVGPGGELVLRSLYRSWTAVFFTIPVMSTSDREVRFPATEMAPGLTPSRPEPAALHTDCSAVTGHYETVGSYLAIPGNRNDTELKSVTIQQLLPFAAAAGATAREVSRPVLTVEHHAIEGLTLNLYNPGAETLQSRVEASRIRCRDGILELGLQGNFDPAATFWLLGIAYGRVQLGLWRDDFGGLMVEAREIMDGTVLVVLPIHHRESSWFRFAGAEEAAAF